MVSRRELELANVEVYDPSHKIEMDFSFPSCHLGNYLSVIFDDDDMDWRNTQGRSSTPRI